MFDVDPVRVQDQDGAEHLIGLRLHQQNEPGKNVHERRAGSDHLEHSALSRGKSLLLFAFGNITADDHAAGYLAFGIPERPAADSNPHAVGSGRVPDKHFDVVDLLAANRACQRQLLRRVKRYFVRQVKAVLARPFGSRSRRCPHPKYLPGRRIED